jgi:hypothetical protein
MAPENSGDKRQRIFGGGKQPLQQFAASFNSQVQQRFSIPVEQVEGVGGMPMALGLLAWTRSPRGARPHRRVRLVFAPDSSRKISLAGSKPSWRRRHARRARAMSGLSCSLARSVFFYMSAPSSSA